MRRNKKLLQLVGVPTCFNRSLAWTDSDVCSPRPTSKESPCRCLCLLLYQIHLPDPAMEAALHAEATVRRLKENPKAESLVCMSCFGHSLRSWEPDLVAHQHDDHTMRTLPKLLQGEGWLHWRSLGITSKHQSSLQREQTAQLTTANMQRIQGGAETAREGVFHQSTPACSRCSHFFIGSHLSQTQEEKKKTNLWPWKSRFCPPKPCLMVGPGHLLEPHICSSQGECAKLVGPPGFLWKHWS